MLGGRPDLYVGRLPEGRPWVGAVTKRVLGLGSGRTSEAKAGPPRRVSDGRSQLVWVRSGDGRGRRSWGLGFGTRSIPPGLTGFTSLPMLMSTVSI